MEGWLRISQLRLGDIAKLRFWMMRKYQRCFPILFSERVEWLRSTYRNGILLWQ